MNAIENDIRALVDKELAAANERFPQFHSAHEGYAVILEEIEELSSEAEQADEFTVFLWDAVKANNPEETERHISIIEKLAINAACEAIQVAAMCKKFLEMEGKR